MVEGRPQLVGDFTGEQSQLDWWIADTHIFSEQAKNTRLEIRCNSRRVRSLKGASKMLELAEVHTGPFNLGADAI